MMALLTYLRRGLGAFLLLWIVFASSLVVAQNNTNSTSEEEEESPFSEDFSNNVFSDLGP